MAFPARLAFVFAVAAVAAAAAWGVHAASPDAAGASIPDGIVLVVAADNSSTEIYGITSAGSGAWGVLATLRGVRLTAATYSPFSSTWFAIDSKGGGSLYAASSGATDWAEVSTPDDCVGGPRAIDFGTNYGAASGLGVLACVDLDANNATFLWSDDGGATWEFSIWQVNDGAAGNAFVSPPYAAAFTLGGDSVMISSDVRDPHNWYFPEIPAPNSNLAFGNGYVNPIPGSPPLLCASWAANSITGPDGSLDDIINGRAFGKNYGFEADLGCACGGSNATVGVVSVYSEAEARVSTNAKDPWVKADLGLATDQMIASGAVDADGNIIFVLSASSGSTMVMAPSSDPKNFAKVLEPANGGIIVAAPVFTYELQ